MFSKKLGLGRSNTGTAGAAPPGILVSVDYTLTQSEIVPSGINDLLTLNVNTDLPEGTVIYLDFEGLTDQDFIEDSKRKASAVDANGNVTFIKTFTMGQRTNTDADFNIIFRLNAYEIGLEIYRISATSTVVGAANVQVEGATQSSVDDGLELYTFEYSNVSASIRLENSTTAQVLLVAGGGAGGRPAVFPANSKFYGGGGGAGGVILAYQSPADNTTFGVQVGNPGLPGGFPSTRGGDSGAFSFTAVGGGDGANYTQNGYFGGSGGGGTGGTQYLGGVASSYNKYIGEGQTVTVPQGYAGGRGGLTFTPFRNDGGGGGGATHVGYDALNDNTVPTPGKPGWGGEGLTTDFPGYSLTVSRGGNSTYVVGQPQDGVNPGDGGRGGFSQSNVLVADGGAGAPGLVFIKIWPFARRISFIA